MNETKPKLRWFRFSLRALLIVVTVLCIWLGIKVNSGNHQKHVVAIVKELGGEVRYDYEWGDDPFQHTGAISDLDWLSKTFGVDYFHNVVAINFGDSSEAKQPRRPKKLRDLHSLLPQLEFLPKLREVLFSCSNIHDDDLLYLSKLADLQYLFLFDTNITGAGLKHLSKAKQLEMLWFSECPITAEEVGPLLQLPQLSWLQLENAKLTDAGVKQLANIKTLEWLNLYGNQLTDSSVEHLARLPNLAEVILSSSGITYSGVGRLQKLRPNLYIQCDGYFTSFPTTPNGSVSSTGKKGNESMPHVR